MTRIVMIVFSYYPGDTRVRREAEALVAAGMSVDVICLKLPAELQAEEINGVRAHRLNLNRKRSSKLRYLFEYGVFISAVILKLTRLHFVRRFHIVHVHNMPDILVFSAIIPKLAGAKIILDLHDPMPELYMTKYAKTSQHPAVRLLKCLEKISIRFADSVITPNISFRNLFISRSCPRSKIHIVMNSPIETIFERKDFNPGIHHSIEPDKFVIMYHGFIAERNGLDIAIKAVARIRKHIPNVVLNVYGEGDFLKQSCKLVDSLSLNDCVKFNGAVSSENIAAAIENINIGIIPNKRNPFTDLNFPTRIFEYLAMGKPVIAPPTQGIKDYFGEESLHYFTPGDANSLAHEILNIYSNPAISEKIVHRGAAVYRQHRWELQRKNLVYLVSDVLH